MALFVDGPPNALLLSWPESVMCGLQATIAEMVRDEEEDAMRSAAASGKEPPRSDALYASFTSEDDEDGPARSKGRRRRKPEPSRQRPGASGRSSRPVSTTASPIKVRSPSCTHEFVLQNKGFTSLMSMRLIPSPTYAGITGLLNLQMTLCDTAICCGFCAGSQESSSFIIAKVPG